MSNIYIYYRVSTDKQDTKRQKQVVEKYVKDNNMNVSAIFEDKVTGKNFERSQYQALKKTLHKGDTLIIKELDRLGRNYKELGNEWRDIADKGASIIVIDTPMLSTQGKSDLETILITDIVFSLLAYTAEKERLKIIQRVKEGMDSAKVKGTRSGKPIGRPQRKDTIPKDFEKYYKRWLNKEITGVEFAKLLGLSRMTLYRYIKTYEELKA